MALSSDQLRELWEVFRASFTPARLNELLRFGLDKQLQDITLAGDFRAMVFELLDDAERAGYTLQLVDAARQAVPKNERLWKLAQTLQLTSASAAYEKLVREDLGFLPLTQWRTRLAEIEGQVCRISTGSSYGTGFLVGPDLVMTNYHVVEDIIDSPDALARVVCLFDYRALADGTTINKGTEFSLDAGAPIVDYSEYSSLDGLESLDACTPKDDELDYALLRLSTEAGRAPINPKDYNAPPRGWFKVPTGPVTLATGGPLHIVQHPDKRPMELALETQAILGFNPGRTRVRYRTNTEGGSSGSPCCDGRWNLVALHHVGDPKYGRFSRKGDWNQGVPFDAIVSLLTKRSLGHLLHQAVAAT